MRKLLRVNGKFVATKFVSADLKNIDHLTKGLFGESTIDFLGRLVSYCLLLLATCANRLYRLSECVFLEPY